MTSSPEPTVAEVVTKTREWLERVVIGLNLCPFAKTVHVRNQIRYFVSSARDESQLVNDLQSEIQGLRAACPEAIDTTLIIHPWVLGEFAEFNQFLDLAEAVLAKLGAVGEIQLASFHPHYQFAGASPDDITNYTNRSPYPMLHLLREASVARAIETFSHPEEIYEANLATLRQLGHTGWQKIWAKPGAGSTEPMP